MMELVGKLLLNRSSLQISRTRLKKLCVLQSQRTSALHNNSTNRHENFSNKEVLDISEKFQNSQIADTNFKVVKSQYGGLWLRRGHSSANLCHRLHWHKRSYSSSAGTEDLSVKNLRVQGYLDHILQRFIKAQTQLVAGKIGSEEERQEINKTVKSLKSLVMPLQEYYGKEKEIEDLMQMANEMGKDDPEIQDAAKKEISDIEDDMSQLEKEILYRIVPLEPVDNSNIILEVIAGVGGNEAFLFTHEIFQMYESYAAYNGWNFSVIAEDEHGEGHGGLRKATAGISGEDVYKTLKYEGGVHRVQRVPKTEKHGRIHTSTTTVSILPEASEIDIKLNPKDLKVDTYRSSGPGGQHVNTTDSAVRVKHIPTGITAECQTDRSQVRNKANAMKILLSRLYQRELDMQQATIKKAKKIQVGSAGRSEKIRTYNFKNDRITDHRLSENMFNLDEFLTGNSHLDSMIQSLQFEAWKEKLFDIIGDHDEKNNKKSKS